MATGAALLKSMRVTLSQLVSLYRELSNWWWSVSVLWGSVEASFSLSISLYLSLVAPVAPVDLSTRGSGSTWIYLQWFQPSASRGNPPLSGHVISVQEVGGGKEERRFDGDSAEANVTDLLPGTEYIFSVVAVSEFGELQAPSPASVSANGTTTLTGKISTVFP